MVNELKNIKELLEGKVDGKIVSETITRLTANGENFCSLMLKLDLEVQKNESSAETYHLVAKCLPVAEIARERLRSTMLSEIQWYAEIMEIFKEFQRNNGFEDIADFFPKMIAGRINLDLTQTDEVDDDSVLILENLIHEGYKNEDRYVGFNLEQTKSILKRLATFAGVFIGLKLKNPEVFEEKVKKYFIELPPPTPEQQKEVGTYVIKAIEENQESALLLDRILPIIRRPSGVEPHQKEPWATVCHSDVWVNNIMVRSEAGKETKVKFVDFQMCVYRSYAADLIFFLLSSVQTAVQKAHFEDLLRFYYDEFTKNLRQLNLSIALSYDEYLEELRIVARQEELPHALAFSTIIFGEKNAQHVHTEDPDFHPHVHMTRIARHMSQLQKDKISLMTVLAARVGWI